MSEPLASGRSDRAGCDSNEADSAAPCMKCSGQNVPHCTCPEWCGYHLCLHVPKQVECRCVVAGDQLLSSACLLHGDGSATPEWVAGVARALTAASATACRWCNTEIQLLDKWGWVHEDTTSIYCLERIAEPKP